MNDQPGDYRGPAEATGRADVRAIMAELMAPWVPVGVPFEDIDVESMRNGWAAMFPDPPDDIQVDEIELAGRSALSVQAPNVGDAVVLHLFAGGFIIGSPYCERDFAGRVSRSSGARVVMPEYRLATEHRFPAALDDAVAAFSALVEMGVDPDRIVISGHSAGGGLALSTVMELRDLGQALPAAVVSISPMADLTLSAPSLLADPSGDPMATVEDLDVCSRRYLQGADPTDPRASPLFGSFAALPPLLLVAGAAESLVDDTLRVADRARVEGVQTDVWLGDAMTHVFPLLAHDARVPEAQAAIEAIGAFIRRLGL